MEGCFMEYSKIYDELRDFWFSFLGTLGVPKAQKLADVLAKLFTELVGRWMRRMKKFSFRELMDKLRAKKYSLEQYSANTEIKERLEKIMEALDEGKDVLNDLVDLIDELLNIDELLDEMVEKAEESDNEESRAESNEEETEEDTEEVSEEEAGGEGALEFTATLMTEAKFYRADTGEMIDWSAETLEEVYNNFKAGVVNFDIPVNIEHDKEYGAVGRVKDLKLEDGKLYAVIELKKEFAELRDRFRYLSAEIVPEWVHPLTGEVYHNVLVGVALTNYPAGMVEPFSLERLVKKAVEVGVPPFVVGAFKKYLSTYRFNSLVRKSAMRLFEEIIEGYAESGGVQQAREDKPETMSLVDYLMKKYNIGRDE